MTAPVRIPPWRDEARAMRASGLQWRLIRKALIARGHEPMGEFAIRYHVDDGLRDRCKSASSAAYAARIKCYTYHRLEAAE